MKKYISFFFIVLIFISCTSNKIENNNVDKYNINKYIEEYYSEGNLVCLRPFSFKEGLAEVSYYDKTQKKILYGFINKNGEVAIKPQFDFCSHFKEGSALVFSGNFLNHRPIGYIDKTGKMVIKVPENCFSAYNFSEGLARFEIMNPKYKHLFGYIDTSGEIVITPKLKGAYDFSEGLALVCKESGWCFIGKSGKTVIESFFEEAESFSEGLANVKINGKWGYIDKTGKIIIEPQFTSAKPFSDGMAIIGKQQDKNIPGKFDKLLYGYIDKTGEIVIEPKFYEARPFKEGLAAVKVVDKYGFINNVGEMVIATVFRHVMYDFSEGFACVLQKSDEGFFFIDKEGNNIFNRFFPTPSTFSEGLAPISIYREYDEEDKILYKANQWGYIDKTGKVIIEFPIVIKKSS